MNLLWVWTMAARFKTIATILVSAPLAFTSVLGSPLTVPEYPPMGNVQIGCSGVQHCVVYFSGGGDASLQDVQHDIQSLTNGFPSNVGIIVHRPTKSIAGKLVYSSADLDEARAHAALFSAQFGTQLHTVGISEGVRAMREIQGSYGTQTGLWVEIDPFSPFSIPPASVALHRDRFISYYGYYSTEMQGTWHTGPPDFDPPFPFHSIALGGILPLQFVADFHKSVIPLGLNSAWSVLTQRMAGNIGIMDTILLWQHANQWVAADTQTGESAVTSPPLGSGPTAPSGGGGLGVESFPAWLSPKECRDAIVH